MMRLVGFLLLVLAMATPALAKTAVADLRERMIAGDVAAVEAMFAAAHHSVETENGDYSEQRELFSALAVTDPRALDFVDVWRKAKPASPYAQTAKAWQLMKMGGWVRGEETVRWTYPDAMAANSAMEDMAADLAASAYAAAPDLVGASDAMLGLGHKARRNPEDVIEEVMRVTPNARSIRTAKSVVIPQWGGSIRRMKSLCETYAPVIRDVEGYDADYCMIETAMRANYCGDDLKPFTDMLDASDDPALDPLRIVRAGLCWTRMPDKVRPLIAAYLDNPETTDIQVARVFDGRSRVLGEPLRELKVTERRIAKARDMIEFDPYNPDILRILATTTVAEQGAVANPPSEEEVWELTLRGLAVAPFSPAIWRDLAYAKLDTSDAAVHEGEPLFENAIVYSNHKPGMVAEYGETLRSRMMNLAVDKGIKWGEPVTADALDADIERLMCLTVRIGRIYDAICPEKSNECNENEAEREGWAQSTTNADALGICKIERNSPVGTLAFTPRAVPGVTVAD